MRRLRGTNARAVTATLNPVIRGWTAYHRGMVSRKIFESMGRYTWRLTYKWARQAHPNKGARWVTSRYYGKFCPARNDNWVFGDRGNRRLPAQPRLDGHPAARHGQGPGIPR
jgi:RNA-directed DNA polymerase